jgi:hypothetical protein
MTVSSYKKEKEMEVEPVYVILEGKNTA